MTCNKQKYQWESWEPSDCRDDWGGIGHEDDIQEQEPELLPKPITSLSSSILIEDAKANDLRHMFASSMFSSSKTIEDFDDISIDSDETIRMGNNSSNNILFVRTCGYHVEEKPIMAAAQTTAAAAPLANPITQVNCPPTPPTHNQ